MENFKLNFFFVSVTRQNTSIREKERGKCLVLMKTLLKVDAGAPVKDQISSFAVPTRDVSNVTVSRPLWSP